MLGRAYISSILARYRSETVLLFYERAPSSPLLILFAMKLFQHNLQPRKNKSND